MTTLAQLLREIPEREFFEARVAETQEVAARDDSFPTIGGFAERQIRRLNQQIFLSGWSKPARQVVFSAVDGEVDIGGMCLQVAEQLAGQVQGSVCVVEANIQGQEANHSEFKDFEPGFDSHLGVAGGHSLREASHRLSGNLWYMPPDVLAGHEPVANSAVWMRGRLAELRLDFDYTVLHGPAASEHSEAALMGHLCDGLVLVLEANLTRRVAAQKAKETLQAANVRLLGTVLTERVFPIPEAIYQRL